MNEFLSTKTLQHIHANIGACLCAELKTEGYIAGHHRADKEKWLTIHSFYREQIKAVHMSITEPTTWDAIQRKCEHSLRTKVAEVFREKVFSMLEGGVDMMYYEKGHVHAVQQRVKQWVETGKY